MVWYLFLALGAIWPVPELLIPLIGTPVSLEIIGEEHSPVLLYNMHDNENTSAIAGRIVSTRYGGEYYELIHNGERLIGFSWKEDSLWIDPNRIYTDAGIWQQLAKNQNCDTILFFQIAEWRDSLLSLLKIQDRSLVIALHNNTNRFYGLDSYTAGGEYELEADTTHQGRIQDADDFYFVTDSTIFNTLAQGRYHVILQANETATDDGSLSVYCAKYGIPYINVEAQHRHLVRQVKMLIFAFQKLVPKS